MNQKITEKEKILLFLQAMTQLLKQSEEQPLDDQLDKIEYKLNSLLQKIDLKSNT